ncbi:Uncharacterised protein [Salmonella enterica subsp. enterica serovar Typhi]|nr:hypothetical protein SM252143_07190 [Salmonella enterica subsp. enterica serovar Typhi]AYU44866.1 hypothetical protein SM251131_07086 [Salmonella enterica subsp. enterica serovar Typhi]CGX42648.1 Uncharacterised protein [Salmonella enterica subsp. enterica serovar Typhi]CGZ72776.1 Uncharacterised protein [Salmonella enterica subsp. enterica serovar Typhi]CGZ73343.1 Uncharacterised protein [Salmonella enterica subsp. enterica serovar Typhi]
MANGVLHVMTITVHRLYPLVRAVLGQQTYHAPKKTLNLKGSYKHQIQQ